MGDGFANQSDRLIGEPVHPPAQELLMRLPPRLAVTRETLLQMIPVWPRSTATCPSFMPRASRPPTPSAGLPIG